LLVRLGAAALDARGRSLLEGSGSAQTGGIGDTSAAGGANVANETGQSACGRGRLTDDEGHKGQEGSVFDEHLESVTAEVKCESAEELMGTDLG